MARVYISSTYEDLKEHREAVWRALGKLAGSTVVCMENYVAADQRPLERCVQDVQAADIYVGIFAWRYGYVPAGAGNPEGRSITELELRAAQAAGKHCLIFVLDDKARWDPPFMDQVTGDGDSGARIKALRKELLETYLASKFADSQQLAGLATAAVANWAQQQGAASTGGAAVQAGPTRPELRELQNSVYLLYSPADQALARQAALALGGGLERPVLLSAEALFAEDEAGFAAVEQHVTRCHAALVLLTPGAAAQLQARAERVAAVLEVLRARTGRGPLALLSGVKPGELPAAWRFEQCFELAAAPAAAGADPALVAARAALDRQMPPWGVRSVGLPISLVAMNAAELAQLEGTPDFIADRLGKPVQQQYERLKQQLAAEGIAWMARYAADREDWRPFDAAGKTGTVILEEIARELNRRSQPRLKHRHIKLQWYPFEPVLRVDAALRPIYREVAKAGSVVLVDEVSLFHPDIREAFQNCPFFNNDRVAIVTVSPFDPDREPLNQLLETEMRRKLAGAFDRYAVELDPQCELAVGDERRLKRWLHLSLPETINRLQELQPDRGAILSFVQELGGDPNRPKSDYPWGGGGRP